MNGEGGDRVHLPDLKFVAWWVNLQRVRRKEKRGRYLPQALRIRIEAIVATTNTISIAEIGGRAMNAKAPCAFAGLNTTYK